MRCPVQISLSCGTRRYSRRAVLAGCGDLPTLAGTWPGYENPARPPTAAVRCSHRCRRGRTTQRYRASGHATQGIRKKMEFLHSCTSPRVSDYFLFNRPQNRDDQCIVQSALSHAFCAFGSFSLLDPDLRTDSLYPQKSLQSLTTCGTTGYPHPHCQAPVNPMLGRGHSHFATKKWGNKRKQKRSARTLSRPTRPLVTFKRGRERQSAPASRPRSSASTAGLAQRRGWKWGRDGRRLFFFHTRKQGPRSFPLTPERRSQRRPRAGSSSESSVSGRGWGIGSPATSFRTPRPCSCIL